MSELDSLLTEYCGGVLDESVDAPGPLLSERMRPQELIIEIELDDEQPDEHAATTNITITKSTVAPLSYPMQLNKRSSNALVTITFPLAGDRFCHKYKRFPPLFVIFEKLYRFFL